MAVQGASAKPEVLTFFEEMTRLISEEKGPVTKAVYERAAMKAALKLSPDSKDALLNHIDNHPKETLANLDKAADTRSALQQALIVAPAAYGLRTFALPTLKNKGIPIVMNFFVPGSGPIVEHCIIPAVDFAGEFGINMASYYLGKMESGAMQTALGVPEAFFVQSMNNTTTFARNALGRLGSLLRRSPSTTVPPMIIPTPGALAASLPDVVAAATTPTPQVIIRFVPIASIPRNPSSVVIEEVDADELEATSAQKPKNPH
jgi:hypothetical protein